MLVYNNLYKRFCQRFFAILGAKLLFVANGGCVIEINSPRIYSDIAITTYLEKREDTIISLLDNFGILQVGMPLFLQCEKQDILVCIKINSRTIVIGRISDDVVNDFDLIDSYLDYNCILKDFKVYENKTSNIIIELRRGQIVSQNRDTDEIDLSDEPNEELPFMIITVKMMLKQ